MLNTKGDFQSWSKSGSTEIEEKKTCKWKRIASPTPHIEGNVEEGIENEESERKGSRFTVALCR